MHHELDETRRPELMIDSLNGVLRASQWIPLPIDQVFGFFSNAHNLETITPAFLNFKVLRMNTASIQEGTEIDYRLRLKGIPIRWTSRILDWKPPYRFSDVQVRGPYRLWFHRHEFYSHADGTTIVDRVDFRVPWHQWMGWGPTRWVASDVKAIFTYRQKAVCQALGVPFA